MACEDCNDLFVGDFLCINVPNNGTLQYGVQFLGLETGPNAGQTSVFYRICNCNEDGGGTGISHVNFELCTNGILPVAANVVGGGSAEIDPNGDAIFGVPNFKIENFGDVDAGECITLQLIYDAEFTTAALVEGLFGIKIGGGPALPTTTGSVEGLPIPCLAEIEACIKDVTAEICSQATVTLTPIVTPGTPTVTCINGPLINETCPNIPGFTPLPSSGSCSFTVSQIICVTIPLDFSVNVTAVPSGGACGPVVPGTDCPPLPTT